MTTIINAVASTGLTVTSDGSGVVKLQSAGVTTNALAWVNFNGTTSPGTIRSSYNVGSVTKNGTGDYTVNFTTALSDANYSVAGSCSPNSTGSSGRSLNAPKSAAPTTSAIRISTASAANMLEDQEYVSVSIFGN
jgi:hypothetical protein